MDPNLLDPNAPSPGGDPAADPAAAAASGGEGGEPPVADPQAELMAAVDAAIEGKEPPAPAAEGDDPAASTEGDDPAAVKPDGEAKPEGEGAKAEGETKPEGEAKKPSDEFGALPENTPAKTRERFDALKGKYDELHGQAEVWREGAERADKWQQTVESTGATAEQFGTMLGYLKAVNGGDKASLEAAYAMVMEEAEVIAKALGRPFTAGERRYDPLEDPANADLKAKVEAEGLDEAVARELAANRAGAKVDTAAREARAHADTATQEQEAALTAIRSFGAQAKAADPAGYAAKMALIQPGVDLILNSLPPARWAAEIRTLYERTPTPRAAAPDPRAHAPAQPQTLRPSGTPNAGGGMGKAAGSALEAVDMALASLGT